ncbi:DUF4156 domain-containing protein [Candidatus Methylospira mobilis]|uniref:DUF4156 domain-containing protein n=1 Tax=Candidatus Methylospira mobilis TaxID=1808979 RepID=A0A5Q0BH66_9GAMM|nr:DUF4156 domain-containing protein [Candidatus Methylospira mobilis]QFY41514.1 DUF4156 domain-containing protein [Candidatus Methylospira mobilis]WNV05250.1 DUF4156 domain-containing protein [Candidatus Methylospira mobilis]
MKAARYANLFLLSAALLACAPTPLIPGAESVHALDVSPDTSKAPCTLLGKEVVGTQGNVFGGDYTSIENLNELKNAAYKLGANAIYIQQRRDINRAGGTVNATITVSAYKCK